MNMDEALHATIMGDKVTHDGLGRDTFVDYNFDGFVHKTMKRFGVWASCSFIASAADEAADWRIIEWAPPPAPRVVEAAKWGPPAASVAPPAPAKPVTGLDGFLAAQGPVVLPEWTPMPADLPPGTYEAKLDGNGGIAEVRTVPKRDSWGRPID